MRHLAVPSTGQLLRCCFGAVESLQTTDMPLLIRYVASILGNTAAGAFGAADADKFQETQVLFYCHSIFAKHLGSLNEDQVMGHARDEAVFARVAHVVDKHGAALVPEALDAALHALSGVATRRPTCHQSPQRRRRVRPAPSPSHIPHAHYPWRGCPSTRTMAMCWGLGYGDVRHGVLLHPQERHGAGGRAVQHSRQLEVHQGHTPGAVRGDGAGGARGGAGRGLHSSTSQLNLSRV